MTKLAAILILISLSCSGQSGRNVEERGSYFAKKVYDPTPIPSFETIKNQLPSPILTGEPEWIAMYWKCWEIAFNKIKKPALGSPFVSNYMDEAFSENIFQWDMVFMMMFARYAYSVFPAIQSLDNFYVRQHTNGYICREISENSGEDFVFEGRAHTINPPLFSWAEIETYKSTGDQHRFTQVLPVLEKYVEWINQPGDLETANSEEWYKYGRRATGSVHTLYWNTGLGSGMDNTPRGGNGWVDMSCQMVMQYKNLEEISVELGKSRKAKFFREQADRISDEINVWCWNQQDGLYYDVDKNGKQQKWKTAGCFWPMIAGVASQDQSDRLVTHLKDTSSFWRKMPFPTLGVDQPGYSSKGSYWLGGVWAPTNYMIIKGLEKYGYDSLAREATYRYLKGMNEVFRNTGTVWENYMPDSYEQGIPARPDFVGWTGIGPIALLIEQVLGINVDAARKKITWQISRSDEHGIERLSVGEVEVSLKYTRADNETGEASIEVTSSGSIDLEILIGDVKTIYPITPGFKKITV